MFTLYIFYRFDINYYCTRVDFFFTPRFFTIFFQTLFEPMFIAVYNVFYTSQPVLALGIFDQDVDATHSLKFPKLYAPGLSSALFNKREFFKSALHGFISSCFLFFISHGEIFIAKKVREIAIHLINLYFIKKMRKFREIKIHIIRCAISRNMCTVHEFCHVFYFAIYILCIHI